MKRNIGADEEVLQSEESASAAYLGTPIIARRIAEDVVDRLGTAMALGQYVTGQQLPTERELATLLGVSRTSIREALKELTNTGYVEVKRGRRGGYFVRADWGPTSAEHVRRQLVDHWSEFEHLFDARRLVEQLIAATAAQRRMPKDIEAIRRGLEAYVEAPHRDASRRADYALHHAIAEATHNPILTDLSLDLRTRITLNLGAEPYTDEVRGIAIIQHGKLVRAIEEGRAEVAGRIAADHFALSERLMRELVARAESSEMEEIP